MAVQDFRENKKYQPYSFAYFSIFQRLHEFEEKGQHLCIL